MVKGQVDNDKLIALRARGWTFTQIGKELRVGRGAVQSQYYRLVRKGLVKDRTIKVGRYEFTDADSLLVLHLVENERLPYHKIARKMHLSSIEVERHYREIIADLEASERRAA